MKQIFDFNFALAIPDSTQALRNLFFIDDQPGASDTIVLDTLVLSNPDNAAITLLHQADQTVSAANHHFDLHFDPDTLPDIANIEIEQSTDWAILAYQHAGTGDDPKGGVSIYFLHKGASDLVLQPGTPLSLTLKKFSAASTGDVRTSTVNFNFNTASGYIRIGAQAGNQFFPSQNNPYETSGTKVIDILNKSRSIHAPLEVGFYSTNRVLNDGSTQNELQLRIVNLSATALPMVATGGTQATFQLSFDSTGAWALADSVAQQSFTVNGGNDFDVSWDHESYRWNLTPKASTWPAGGSVTVTISEIVSDKATGRSLLHLGYQQIPGYGDASFVVPIEKSALCLVGDKVGVGTTSPDRALTVHASRHGIQHTDGTTKVSTFVDGDGGWLGTESDHSLLFYTNGSGAQVALKTNGNVGIGTTDPGSKLEIRGNDDALRLWGTEGTYDYGAKLSFGDGDNAYLQEDSDDHIKIHARTGISLEIPDGDVSIGGNTNISGDASISGRADISGNASINGRADISGNASISGDVSIGGSISNGTSGQIHSGDVYTSGYLWSAWYGVYEKLDNFSGNAEWSDRELKKDIRRIDRPLDKLLELQGCEYRWDEKKHFGRPEEKVDQRLRMGLIAQDVESVLPDLVEQSETVTRKILDDGDFDEKVYEHKTIDYAQLHALTIEAIKEIKAEKDQEITELKDRIAALEKKPSA